MEELFPPDCRFVISDLDGTLVRLDVPWAKLRADLGLKSIGQLWDESGKKREVARSTLLVNEVRAAQKGKINNKLTEALQRVPWGILTNNSSLAAREVVRRIGADLEAVTIVGREELIGPKEDFQSFASSCNQLKPVGLASHYVCYVGDQPYEIEYASSLGFQVVDMAGEFP